MALWLDSTYAGATEPSDEPPPAWVASVSLRGRTADQCLNALKLLLQGVEMEVPRLDGTARALTTPNEPGGALGSPRETSGDLRSPPKPSEALMCLDGPPK